MNSKRSIFFLNGKQDHWIIGRRNAIWGLPISRSNWSAARACLQELGFIAGSEVLAISGPYAHFQAVIGSDRGVYYDTDSAPFGFGPGNDIYPVRFKLTNVKNINQDWFDGPRGVAWREPLQDVYFSNRSLFILPPHNAGHKFINQRYFSAQHKPYQISFLWGVYRLIPPLKIPQLKCFPRSDFGLINWDTNALWSEFRTV